MVRATGLDLHFPLRRKYMFASVKPSAAMLVRIAFDLFKSCLTLTEI